MKDFFCLCTIIVILSMCITFYVSTVYADLHIDVTEPSGGAGTGVDNDLEKVGEQVWDIVLTVLRFSAMTVFVYTGIRYMNASADQKADIKKSMVPLVIGALIVFGGTYVVDFVISLFKDVSGMP